MKIDISRHIFRAYDIRGIYNKDISPDLFYRIGLAAGTYTELVWESDSVGAKASGIISVQTGRAPAGSKVWARCMAPGKNTSRLDFYIGLHEYEG